VASHPLEKICIDFVGPLTKDKDVNEYILTVIDVFTQYLFAFPVKSRSAENVAEKLLQGVFFQVLSELIFRSGERIPKCHYERFNQTHRDHPESNYWVSTTSEWCIGKST
jgi:hypothetical protein